MERRAERRMERSAERRGARREEGLLAAPPPPPTAPLDWPPGARRARKRGGHADVDSVRIGDEYVAHVPLAHKTQPPGRAGLNTII